MKANSNHSITVSIKIRNPVEAKHGLATAGELASMLLATKFNCCLSSSH
jgi:hypothetical protein